MTDKTWYAIKHKNAKRWQAFNMPESHLKHLKAGYEWRGPFTSLFKAMVSVNEEAKRKREAQI
jgi:hypothetical protein